MLTLNANFVAAFRKESPEARYLVTLVLDSGTYKAIDGPVALSGDTAGYPASVGMVSPFAARLDIIKRSATLGELTVTFIADGWASALVVANRMRGKSLSVKLGEASLAEADYVSIFSGVISTFTPTAAGGVVVKALNGMGVVKDTKITGYFENKHPLEVISSITTKANVPSSLIDAASLTASTYAGISHYVINRGPLDGGIGVDLTIRTPTSALQLLSEVAATIDGMFVDGEDGKLRFILYDSTTAVVDNWTEDDFGTLVQQPLGANVLNDVTVKFGGMGADDGHLFSYQLKDSDSITNFGFPGAGNQTFAEEIKTPWLNGSTWLQRNLDNGAVDGAGATFDVFGGSLHAMCGVRWPSFPGTAQPADAKLSASRTAFIKIDAEIIEVDLLTVSSTNVGAARLITDPTTGAQVTDGPYPIRGTYRIKTRGALGTTAAAHTYLTGGAQIADQPPGAVTDYTMAVAMARARITRYSNDVPVITCITNFSKLGVQLGDLITLTTTRYTGYGDSGLATTTKWEVTGKEADKYASPPCIKWELTWATKTGAATPTEFHVIRATVKSSLQAAVRGTLYNNEIAQKSVITGLAVSATAGLGISVSAGKASQIIYRYDNPAALALTLPASQTNWIFVDFGIGAIGSTPSATQPTLPSHQMILAQVVTSGVAVTNVINYLNQGAIQANVISPASIHNLGSKAGKTINPTFGLTR